MFHCRRRGSQAPSRNDATGKQVLAPQAETILYKPNVFFSSNWPIAGVE